MSKTHILHVQNVNHALEHGLTFLRYHGLREDSRNGPVLVAPGPVITETVHPEQRVLFSPLRDANPFFHLTEALWMLAGRNEIDDLTPLVKTFGQFSDDGKTMPAAYGHRWRKHFGHDQLWEIVEELRTDPKSRRCVLAMWDPGFKTEDEWPGGGEGYAPGHIQSGGDLTKETKDKPCNTHVYFRIESGKLDMTVLCRSNDAVWGAHGANAVHFSVLQEWMAASIGVQLGTMYQVSNNYHIYAERDDVKRLVDGSGVHYVPHNLYNHVRAVPLVQAFETTEDFQLDCEALFDKGFISDFTTLFFRDVYLPMMQAWWSYRDGWDDACRAQVAQLNGSVDWHVDASRWLSKRLKARNTELPA